MDIVNVLKGSLPRELRRSLRLWRRDLKLKLLPVDRVTDFDVLRRVRPWRPAWGLHRGKPIDRYYIEKFLATHQASICGTVLEVDDNRYTLQFGGNRITRSEVIDIKGGKPAHTIVDDLTICASIADDTFDCIICTQVLQLIFDYQAAVRTMHRILKPGGVLLATFPGIAQLCPPNLAEADYWRFSPQSSALIFGEAFGSNCLEVSSYGNVLTAVALLHGLVVPELTEAEFDYTDPLYDVIVGVKAQKAS